MQNKPQTRYFFTLDFLYKLLRNLKIFLLFQVLAVLFALVASSVAAPLSFTSTVGNPVPVVYSVPSFSSGVVSSASPAIVPSAVAQTYSVVPVGYSFNSPIQTISSGPIAYSSPVIHSSPVVYSAPSVQYSAPSVQYSAPVVTGTAVEPGYVARTLGVEHKADLPEGLGYASHHINIQPAPGTGGK